MKHGPHRGMQRRQKRTWGAAGEKKRQKFGNVSSGEPKKRTMDKWGNSEAQRETDRSKVDEVNLALVLCLERKGNGLFVCVHIRVCLHLIEPLCRSVSSGFTLWLKQHLPVSRPPQTLWKCTAWTDCVVKITDNSIFAGESLTVLHGSEEICILSAFEQFVHVPHS